MEIFICGINVQMTGKFLLILRTEKLCNYLSKYVIIRGTSILGEVRNVEIPGPTQQLLCSKYHDFLAVFPLAHSKINQIS